MSRFPVHSRLSVEGWGPHIGAAEASRRPFGRAARLTCAAVIALAVAGCSQEVQRFDYGSSGSRTAHLHDTENRYAEDGFASWRRAERGDLQRHAQLDSDPVTRSLPDDAGHQHRSQLTPLYDRAPQPPRRATHTVKAGDTLYSIARRHNVSVNELARINGLSDPSRILIGDTLYIPDGSAGHATPAVEHERAGRRPTGRAETRPQPRTRRYAERGGPRYADDELYADPLLSEQHSQDERRGHDEHRSAARAAPEPRRAAPTTPPPAPEQRPQARQPSQIAQSQAPDPSRIARAEPPEAREVVREQKTSAAECRALMQNPPARSGANFRRPVNGLIISRFGEQSNGQRNDGINISVPRGTPVKAAENGVVVYAGEELMGLGKLVLVRHADGWVSAYAHNDEITVQRCETVERGQVIARAGVSGAVTKPQVHFELRKNARPVDPEQHLAGTS